MSNSKTKLIIFSILTVIICLLICFVPVTAAYSAPIAEKKAEQTQILAEIEDYQAQLDILSNDYNDALIRLDAAESKINELKNEIQIAQETIETNSNQLDKQAIYTYKYGNVAYLDVLLNSSTFGDFLTNLDYSTRIMGQTEDLIEEQKQLKQQLQSDLEEQKQAKAEAENAAATVKNSMNDANAIISQLQSDYDKLDGEIAEIITQQEREKAEAARQASIVTTVAESTQESAAIIQKEEEKKQSVQAKSAAAPAPAGNSVVERAYSKIGCPYSWGGTTSSGFDCSGFVSYCLSGQEGVRLGSTGDFIGWPQVSDPQPGDVCVVHNSSHQHTGIYVGGGMMVHASTYGVGVIEGPVSGDMIYVRYPG